jgi:PAS domain S-box-containing protein
MDDDEVDRLAVRRCVQQSGIAATLDEATSVPELMERLRAASYDCLLLDYHVPGVDSTALLREARRAVPETPVVMMTGRGDQEIAVELMKAGAADYLPKASLTSERLASSIRHALEIARAATARRRAEEEVRTQEAHFRTLANAIPQLAWISEPDGRRSWYNDRWYEFTGLSFDDVRDFGWHRIHHPDHLNRVREGQYASFARGEVWEDTYPLRRYDGVYRWFLSRAVPIRDESGRIVRWLGTNTDITEWKEAELERERLLVMEQESRTRAERAMKLREEILAVVAHDLRDPVHAIAMAAANLLELPLPQDQQMKQLVVMRRSAKRMDRLINDLLDVSRMDAGTFAIRHGTVHLAALIEETMDAFELQAAPRRVHLTTELAGDVPPVIGDRDRLAQVLANLVGNAIKFTPDGGSVRLRAAPLDNGVRVSVEDSGAGIPNDALPHVFDRFWQADRTSRSGAGLGLAIAKGIIDAHGGRIWAESSGGSGTTVHFTVPRTG